MLLVSGFIVSPFVKLAVEAPAVSTDSVWVLETAADMLETLPVDEPVLSPSEAE